MRSILRELPARAVLLSALLALAAAVGVYVLLSDDEGGDRTGGPGLALVPDEASGDPTAAEFRTFDGETRTLADLQGTPVVLNFFASTCVPCITEMPAFEEVHGQVGGEVAFLGLAVQDPPGDAADLVRRTGVTYQTALDPQGDVFAAFGGVVLPMTVTLDADGTVVGRHQGELSAGELRDLIAGELHVPT